MRVALHYLSGTDPIVCLGQLHTLLKKPELPCLGEIDPIWNAVDMLESLSTMLSPEQVDLLTALIDALNDNERVIDLDQFPTWIQQDKIELSTPWPAI